MLLRAGFLAFVASSSLACGGTIAAAPSGADAAPLVDAAQDTRIVAPVDARTPVEAGAAAPRDPVQCAGGGSIAYDKGCTTSADCVVVTVYLGCCHSAALGCNADSVASLVDAGAACATLDPCDCAGNVVIADDGRRSTALNQSDVTVSCLAGQCQSSVQ